MVNPRAEFVQRIRLQLGRADRIDVVGGHPSDAVPGSGAHAHLLADPEGAETLRHELAGLGDRAVVTVVGGQLLVGDTLRCPDHPEIIGAGAAVAPPPQVAQHLRMSCAAVLPLGAHAADVVPAAISTTHGGPTPAERVSLVLQDVFGLPFDHVAEAVGRTPHTCWQLASTARRYLAGQRRYTPDGPERDRVGRFVLGLLACARARAVDPSGSADTLLRWWPCRGTR